MKFPGKLWKKYQVYLAYSICYWGYAVPKIYDMSSNGYAALGGWDAVTQMYPVMLYISRMIRNFMSNLTVPLFELSLGMGDDLITALNWHGFGDPFYLLSALIPETSFPFFYSFLFYFRVYLGGIAFLWFVREHNNELKTSAYVIGTFVYTFSGFTLQANIHIIFVHAMMYIPMMLLGGERVLKEKKKGILFMSTFLFALCGFYYLYIGSIALGIYVIYRLIRMHQQWKSSLIKILEMVIEYLLGLALAAFIFLPSVLGFLNSNRAYVQTQFDWIYSWKEIKNFLINLFFPQTNGQVLSVATIGVIAVLYTLLSTKTKQEKFNISVLIFLTWIPVVSCVMSGFGAIYDRWEVIIILYIAYLVVMQWDFLQELNMVQKIILTGLFCFLGLYGKIKNWWDTEQFPIIMFSYGLIVAFLCILFPIARKMKVSALCNFLFACVMIITICKAWQCNARDREIFYVMERNVVDELIDDTTIYRISNERTFTEPRNGQNIALLQKYYGISEYFSIENPYFTNALLEWDVNPDSSLNHMNVGLDQRTILETLSAVKYMVKRTDSNVLIPYGYEKVKETQDKEWSLYENSNALPLFYSYDSVLKEGLYEGKNGFEKQQIILNTAVIEAYEGKLPRVNIPETKLKQIQYQIKNIEKGNVENGMVILKPGAVLSLQVPLERKGENYLSFDHMDLNGGFTVKVPAENRIKEANITQDFYNGNAGVNLGAATSVEEQEITISFNKAESFPVDNLKVFSYDFSDFEECILQRKGASVTDIVLTTNQIECNVDSKHDRILCIAIPYSKGWNACVDEEKVKVYPMNDMFMGIELPEGKHHVVLSYCTYGLKTGIGISLSALFIILLIFIKNVNCYFSRVKNAHSMRV